MKVMFIYPNLNCEIRIPTAIALLSQCLKNKGHEVTLFDTTFTSQDYNIDVKLREEKGLVKKTDLDRYIGEITPMDYAAELSKLLLTFKPDLVALSCLERNYVFGMKLLKTVKEAGNYPTLVGGIFPTICPDTVISNQYVDMICVGEGEETVVEVCEHLDEKKSLQGIQNLWYKNNERISVGEQRLFIDLDSLPYQDWDLFDLRHLWKPFEGKVYKAGNFEVSRGCLNACSFCVEETKRKQTKGRNAKWRRRKSNRVLVEEIKYFKEKYHIEFFSFGDENFLAQSTSNLRELGKMYAKEVGLPFILQTGVETVNNEEKIRLLKEMNCVTVSLGVESGCEEIRKKVLNKNISDDAIFRAFTYLKKHRIRSTANYIIGLPYETESQIRQSIEFNIRLMPDSIQVFYFMPFRGTALYDLCLQEGLIENMDLSRTDMHKETVINLPHISRQQISDLYDDFILAFNNAKNNQSIL